MKTQVLVAEDREADTRYTVGKLQQSGPAAPTELPPWSFP